MERISDPEDIVRARTTFELYEFAQKAMRQNLRLRFLRESDDEIERRLIAWLRKEPRERWDGAEPPSLSSLQAPQTMTRFEQALIRVSGDLQALDVRWALVGDMAVSFRAEPSATQEIAVAIAAGANEAERITLSLEQRGYRSQPVQHFVEVADGRLGAARLLCPGDEESAVGVDLLFAFSGIEGEIVAGAEICEVLPGLQVPLARTEHLIALKVLAGRFKDLADARLLWDHARPESRARVAGILELIRERGFHRGKDLQAEFVRILETE